MIKAEKKLSEIVVPAIKSRKHSIVEDSIMPIRWLGILCCALFRRRIGKVARHFFVNSSCTKCGICEKICPVDNITRPDGTPIWHNKCESCMACLQWCPVGAIEMPTPMRKLSRYHNPEISAENLYIDKDK